MSEMPGITHITLDLDNTLWDVDSIIIRAEADMRAWMTEQAPGSMAHYVPETLGEIRAGVAQAHGDKIHDLSFMRQRVLEEVMLRSGYAPNEAQALAQGAFEVFFTGRNRVQFFPGARAALDSLSKNYQIYALTNGNADIHQAGLGDYLAGAYNSASVGQSKPHQDMFQAPLKDLNLRPEQVIHVGDNLLDDIHGANSVGMHTIWVNLVDALAHDAPSQPHREISHLSQLVDAVASLDRATRI